MSNLNIKQPSLRICKTLGGFYRVVLHGPDNLQSQQDRPRCCEMDIARSFDKEQAMQQAKDWFDGLDDRCPND